MKQGRGRLFLRGKPMRRISFTKRKIRKMIYKLTDIKNTLDKEKEEYGLVNEVHEIIKDAWWVADATQKELIFAHDKLAKIAARPKDDRSSA